MASRSNRLASKVALVTGGASGIGLAVSQTFLSEGATVFIIDYSAENIEAARSLLQSQGFESSTFVFHQADVTDEETMIAFVDKCATDLGGFDIAVLNAGVGTQDLISDLAANEYDRIMRINARGRTYSVIVALNTCSPLGLPLT